MLGGITGIVLGLYASLSNPDINKNERLSLGFQHNCNPSSEYIQPQISSGELVNRINYKNKLMIEFYRRIGFFNGEEIPAREWIDNGNFDSFRVYEITGGEYQNKNPILIGRFDGSLLYIFHGDGITNCVTSHKTPLSITIGGILEQVMQRR